MSPYIQTYTGKQFYSLNPNAEDVDILDISHSLSLKCRFAGHTKYFYSVAQHSVLVLRDTIKYCLEYDIVGFEVCKWALMHDAAEAYFSDIPKPIKVTNPLFDEIEDKILAAIAKKFDLPWPIPEYIKSIVKRSDNVLLATESRDLLPQVWPGWSETHGKLALKDQIEPWPHDYAKMEFLLAYKKLFR